MIVINICYCCQVRWAVDIHFGNCASVSPKHRVVCVHMINTFVLFCIDAIMPGKLKAKIVAGRHLPVMDRASDLTDAFVEVG